MKECLLHSLWEGNIITSYSILFIMFLAYLVEMRKISLDFVGYRYLGIKLRAHIRFQKSVIYLLGKHRFSLLNTSRAFKDFHEHGFMHVTS